MQQVSLTAQWTAAVRALETERISDRLFVDEMARELAKPEGFALLDRYKGAGVREFVTIRTRFFDDAIASAFKSNPNLRQVVIVAAGMDTRAIRLGWPDGVTIFEVDHRELFQEKSARLKAIGARHNPSLVEVPADLATDWTSELTKCGFDFEVPTLWLVEGLLFFLTANEAQSVLEACRKLSANGSVLVIDMTSQSLLKSPASQMFLAVLRRDGIPWKFGTDEPESFLAAQGWHVREIKEPGQVEASKGRWPYEVLARDVKGVSRSWLIIAEIL